MEAVALQRLQSGLLRPRRQNLCPRNCSIEQAIGPSAGKVDARYVCDARIAAHTEQSHKSAMPVLAHRFASYRAQEGQLQGRSTPFREIRRQPGSRSTVTNASRLVVVCAKASDSAGHAATATPLVLSFGEMLIDFVPTVNGVALADAPAFIPAPGGAPANVAVGVSRLGGQAAFVGKVGDDEFGRMLVRILEVNGVDTSGVRLDQGARTALAFVSLRADGEREFMFYRHPSADMLLRPDELNPAQVRSASVVHFGSISLIAEPCRSAHLALLDAAEQAGVILSYDPNLRLPLWPSAESAREGILSIWKRAHVVKVSEDEVMFLTRSQQDSSSLHESNGDVPQQADELDVRAMSLVHEGLKLLLVTEGEKGCRYYGKGFRGSVAGFHVETIDTTGAGDAFVAGFLSALAAEPEILDDEERLREALRFANACGAIATTVRGAIPALPDRDAALELLGPMGVYLNVEAI